MTTDVLTCSADDDMIDVVQWMKQKRVHRIIVVDELDHVLGIISEGDIARSELWRELPELMQTVVDRYVP